MHDERERLMALISAAFGVRRGSWPVRGSDEGDEPYEVERAFADKFDWRLLEASFLDSAPNGLGSALSFFSDEAFRYYLPAYLLADLDNALEGVDVAFHLSHGLDDKTRDEPINPQRYGARTWLDAARSRFSGFTADEAHAIAEYLAYKADREEIDFVRESLEQALRTYWRQRAGGRTSGCS